MYIAWSLKHDTVPRVNNLHCFYIKNPPKRIAWSCIMGMGKYFKAERTQTFTNAIPWVPEEFSLKVGENAQRFQMPLVAQPQNLIFMSSNWDRICLGLLIEGVSD